MATPKKKSEPIENRTPAYPNPHPSTFGKETAVGRILARSEKDEYLNRLHFQKGLKQTKDGREASPTEFKRFVTALAKHGTEELGNFKLHFGKKGRTFVNPQAAYASDRNIPSPWHFRLPSPPEQDGKMKTAVAEMIELYWMAQLRDAGFTEFETDAVFEDAVHELKELELYPDPDGDINQPTYTKEELTPKTLFRGGELNPEGGERIGPYISQFLTLDVPFGTLLTPQLQRRTKEMDLKSPHMTDHESWAEIQRGFNPDDAGIEIDEKKVRHIGTMGDLARYVHVDGLYEAYLNAALILLDKNFDLDHGNPYGTKCPEIGGSGGGKADPPRGRQNGQEGFGTFGPTHVLTAVCEVASRALKTVWFQKWVAHLRLRPEAFGCIVADLFSDDEKIRLAAENVVGDPANVELLKNSPGVGATSGEHYLPMLYVEGSPTHPAYGAGHATVAGACVTILKAFFNGKEKLGDRFDLHGKGKGKKVVPGKQLGEFDKEGDFQSHPELGDLTIEGELDKLAANISIGRNMAGVHWRSDYTQSILLGQRVAVSMLYHQMRDYHEEPWFLSFTTFVGNTVHIANIPAGSKSLSALKKMMGFGSLASQFKKDRDIEGVFFTAKNSKKAERLLGPEHDFNNHAEKHGAKSGSRSHTKAQAAEARILEGIV